MPRSYVRKGLRAPKGTVPASVLLRLAGGDLERVKASAKARGLSVTAWLRDAVRARLSAEQP